MDECTAALHSWLSHPPLSSPLFQSTPLTPKQSTTGNGKYFQCPPDNQQMKVEETEDMSLFGVVLLRFFDSSDVAEGDLFQMCLLKSLGEIKTHETYNKALSTH